jgi:hypothetical protein
MRQGRLRPLRVALLLGLLVVAGGGLDASPLLVRYPAAQTGHVSAPTPVRLIDGSAYAWADSAAVEAASAAGIDVRILASRQAGCFYTIVYMDPASDPLPLAARGRMLWRDAHSVAMAVPDSCRGQLSEEREILPILDRPIRASVGRGALPVETPAERDELIASLVAGVNPDRCFASVQGLQDLGGRRSDRAGGFGAADSILAAFRSCGLTEVSLFDYNAWCDDVVAVQPGLLDPGAIIVICAHYDSFSRLNPEPGADDNATGVAAVLEAARILAPQAFERTIVYLTFSGEEQGLVGSEAWVADAVARGLDIRAAINLDMIGYVRPGDDRDLDLISNPASIPLMEYASAVTALYLDGYPAVEGHFRAGNSDQQSFWDAGFAALTLHEDSDDSSPYIHSPQDRVGVSVNDPEFLIENTKAAVAILASLAQPLRIQIRHEAIVDPPSWSDGYEIRARIVSTAPLDPDSVRVRYRVDGGPEFALRMEVEGDSGGFAARIPRQPPGSQVEYWIRARDMEGRPGRDPVDAPAHLHSFVVARRTIFADDFAEDRGWSVGAPGDDAASGVWTRAVPVGTGAQPGVDAGGDTMGVCFVTGNGIPGGGEGDADVDRGPTSLISPRLDLIGLRRVEVSFSRWFVDETYPDDTLAVEISNDDGASWTRLRTIRRSERAWRREQASAIDSLVPPTDRMRLRFVVSDVGNPSLLEAAVDDVVVRAVSPRIEAAPAPVTRIVQVLPSPFRTNVSIVYDLLTPARVRLGIFDVCGRRVVELTDETQGVGRREVVWDGRDSRGLQVPAGAYWARLDAGRESAIRVVRIR